MPVGDNLRNIYIFEVGLLRRIDESTTTAQTLALHTLLVAPSNVRTTDGSRSTVTQTVGGAVDTRGGRALRSITMDGTFGVEQRAAGPFGGTGEARLRAFRAEVVRLGDALTKADVLAAIGGDGAYASRLASPGLREALASFNERSDSLFVNFYDFFDNVAAQVVIRQFQTTRAARGGGATGLVPYTMQLDEVGPPIVQSPVSRAIVGLMDFTATWQEINDQLTNYSPAAVLGSAIDSASALGALIVDSMEAIHEVGASTAAIVSLLSRTGGPNAPIGTAADPSVGAFFGLVERAVLSTRYAAAEARIELVPSAHGANDWTAELPPAAAALNRWDLAETMNDIVDGLSMQYVAGAFYGMSPADYRAFVSSGGVQGPGAGYSGTIEHTINVTDTEESIEDTYGVPFDVIEAFNGVDALDVQPGDVLQIPIVQTTASGGIAGLPTFGSHAGTAAWGADILLEGTVTDDGDLAVLDGEDLLTQGAVYIQELVGSDLLTMVDSIPPEIVEDYVARRLGAALLADERLVTIESVTVVQGDGVLVASADVRAINGGTISVGGTGP